MQYRWIENRPQDLQLKQHLLLVVIKKKQNLSVLKILYHFLDNYFASVVAILIGFFFFYSEFNRPLLRSEVDVIKINGVVANYSFKHVPGHRATLKQYYIWLENYPCTFQIPADYLPFFDKKKFEIDIKNGTILEVEFPKEYENKLSQREEFIFILSASSQLNKYLELPDTVKKENDRFDKYVGIGFITLGFVYFFLKRNRFIK